MKRKWDLVQCVAEVLKVRLEELVKAGWNIVSVTYLQDGYFGIVVWKEEA